MLLPFFLVVYDADRCVFSLEGPLLDDTAWERALARARKDGTPLYCVPSDKRTRALARREWQASFPGWTEVEPGTLLHVEGSTTETSTSRGG